jgi:hypothetical protein
MTAVRWGAVGHFEMPSRFDRRSDDFLCGTGTSERFDDRVNQKSGTSSASPT